MDIQQRAQATVDSVLAGSGPPEMDDTVALPQLDETSFVSVPSSLTVPLPQIYCLSEEERATGWTAPIYKQFEIESNTTPGSVFVPSGGFAVPPPQIYYLSEEQRATSWSVAMYKEESDSGALGNISPLLDAETSAVPAAVPDTDTVPDTVPAAVHNAVRDTKDVLDAGPVAVPDGVPSAVPDTSATGHETLAASNQTPSARGPYHRFNTFEQLARDLDADLTANSRRKGATEWTASLRRKLGARDAGGDLDSPQVSELLERETIRLRKQLAAAIPGLHFGRGYSQYQQRSEAHALFEWDVQYEGEGLILVVRTSGMRGPLALQFSLWLAFWH
ncbi:hypothetical protein B0H17DRAFT_1135837 [Mycena rosella]|uniref:Uncharacterized protein n=1 Tax=Mycena rosella TaxID=1033263 RepID=A0AAD7DCN5_MYCRO|nr:hypothetical protein B0H17DRAFT_1135837 [Mycena rosella]